MKHITIIIPVWNEENNITPLVNRIHTAFVKENKSYEIIFVDDFSTDNTLQVIKSLQTKYPIRFEIKKGKRGKAFSLYQGIQKSSSDYIVCIDADLQYPPEVIPKMIKKLENGADVVVANRIEKHVSKVRSLISNSFRYVFGELLFGLNHDIQAGLKVFKREVFQTLSYAPSSGWTFDLEFLQRATEAGFVVESFDIIFAQRINGKSKVSLLKTSVEIGLNALLVKGKKINPIHFPPTDKGSMKGAGVGYKRRKYITHTTLHHSQSAIQTLIGKQKIMIGLLVVLILLGLFLKPLFTAQCIIGALSFIYFVDVLFNFFLVMRSLHSPQEIFSTPDELHALKDENLPIYSILCPLYKETDVIPQFIEAIAKLNWPKEKLDVMLLLEEDDKKFIEAVTNRNLPSYIRPVIVPHSIPKTKPKACNYGLSQTKGEYVVIYDAEDIPDPFQLKKAYLGFQKVAGDVVCLQAKLNYYNPHQNLLTRFFTAEYSLWFDITLTGLQATHTSIPLGGTSNHFRTEDMKHLQGWDPFNVAEDADLGIRLFKKGYKTAIIESITLEEANSSVANWIRQRSRWIKGYMQTYLVHTREDFLFIKNNIIHALFFHLTIGGKVAFILINPLLWTATIAYFILFSLVGPSIQALYPSYVFYIAFSSLVFGNFMFAYLYMLGCTKKEQWELVKYVYCIPIYWFLISWSGVIALYQLLFRPYYWEKTLHGLHLQPSKNKEIPKLILGIRSIFLPVETLREKIIGSLQNKQPFWEGALLILAINIANVLNFIFNAYLGRVLDLENFSLITTLGSFLSFLSIPITAISATVNHQSSYMVGKYGKGASLSIWKDVFKKSLFISVFFACLWIAFSPLFMHFFNINDPYVFLSFIPLLIIIIPTAVNKGFLYGEFLFAIVGVVYVIEPIIKLSFALILAPLYGGSLTYVSIPLSVISSFVFGLVVLVLTTKHISLKETIYQMSFPIKFFLVSVLGGLSAISFLSLDVILAKHFLPPLDAGKYSLLSLTGKIIYFLASLVFPFIMPLVSRSEGANKNSDHVLTYTLLSAGLLTSFGYIVLGLFGYLTVPLFFGPKAISITDYLPVFCLGLVCFSLSQIIVSFYLAKKIYTFSLLAFVLGIIQIILLQLIHQSIADFVEVMVTTAALHIIGMVLLHLMRKHVIVFENNLKDVFELFFSQESPNVNRDRKAILIFNWRDTRHKFAGGAEIYIHELSKRWIKDGYLVTLFCSNDGKSLKHEIIDGVEVQRRGGFYFVYVWAFLYYIFKYRNSYNIILDCENGIPFFTPLYARQKIFLLIHHVHQEVFRKSLIPPFSWLASFLELKLMPLVYKNTQIFTVSPSTKQAILSHKLTTIEPTIIYNGVDLTKFKPGKKNEKPIILYVGRIQFYKSLQVLIHAADKILQKMSDIQFIIAGDGEDKKRMQKLVGKLQIENNVFFLGQITEKEKIELFQKSWVLVNPSMIEGWGITTIEANACGTPAIASDVPGLCDSINNPNTGFLVEYGNADAFAQKIIEIITNNNLREQLSRNAIEWAKIYDWDTSAKESLQLFMSETVQMVPEPEISTVANT